MIRHIRGHSNNGRPIRYSRAYQFYTVRAPPKMKYEDILILQDAFCKEHMQEVQCTLIRGVIVIQPGLKYELFHYTMVPFDHILSKVQIFNYCRFYFYAQC